ncbi:ROK family protein [Streptomyces sp. NPDC048445]|uniref:ROK family protein n=1 Tax=Streptomyces sp. NPDC048445 TaxID=3365553 RepID=UPI003713CB1E
MDLRTRTAAERPDIPGSNNLRNTNVAALLQDLRRIGPMARKQLCQSTGISFTTVTRLCTGLIESGVLAELDPRTSPVAGRRRAGRPETPLEFAQGGRLIASVHIRADSTTCAVVDLTGTEVTRGEFVHGEETDPHRLVARGAAMTRDVLSGLSAERVLGIGVAIGGVVDNQLRTVRDFPLRDWPELDLGAAWDPLGFPVLVDSSVRSLALMELWDREREIGDSSLTVMVAGVVDSAVIVDRRLRRGPGASAGNIRHFPVAGGPGEICSCGRRDCLSTLVSNRALHARAVRVGALPADVPWNAPVEGYTDSPRMARLRRERAEWLGESLGALVEVINPDTTVIAGYLGTEDDVAHVLATAQRRCMATLGRDGGDIQYRPLPPSTWDRASASLVLDDFLRHPTRYESGLLSV